MYACDVVRKVMEPEGVSQSNVKRLIKDLTRCLSKYPENYRFIPFGSCISGLATKSSDIDLMVISGDNQTPVNLKALCNQLRKTWRSRFVMFINCSVPIIKMDHTQIKKKVDISCFNPTSLKNTEIVRSVLSIDNRIRYIILFLKEWMTNHHLLGCGLFTTFALTSMVVFYLQQIEIPLLPPLFLFRQNDNNNSDELDYSFDINSVRTLLLTNDDSLSKLLLGFFEFYAVFEYDRYVISPYYGKIIPIADINDPEALPDPFLAYKNSLLNQEVMPFKINNRVFVQSAFQHNINVTRTVGRKTFINFVKFCKEAVNKLKTDERPFENIFGKEFEFLAYKHHIIPDEHAVIQYDRNAINQALQRELSLNEQCMLVAKTMEYVLRHVFLCELLETTTKEDENDESGYKKTTVIVRGTSTKDVISNRKIEMKKYNKRLKNERKRNKTFQLVYWNSQFLEKAKENGIVDPESLLKNTDNAKSCIDEDQNNSSNSQSTNDSNDHPPILGQKQFDYKIGSELLARECDDKTPQTSAEPKKKPIKLVISDMRKRKKGQEGGKVQPESQIDEEDQNNSANSQSTNDSNDPPPILGQKQFDNRTGSELLVRECDDKTPRTSAEPKKPIKLVITDMIKRKKGQQGGKVQPESQTKGELDKISGLKNTPIVDIKESESVKIENSKDSETHNSEFPRKKDYSTKNDNFKKYSEVLHSVKDVEKVSDVKSVKKRNNDFKRREKGLCKVSIAKESIFDKDIELSKLMSENMDDNNSKTLNVTVTITSDNYRILVSVKGNCKATASYFTKNVLRPFPLLM